MFLQETFTQGIRAFISPAQGEAQAGKVSWFGFAQIAPEKAWCPDHQVRFVVTDYFTYLFVIQGVGIGDGRHAVIKWGPEISGKSKHMKIGKICQKRVIFIEIILGRQAFDI